MAAAFDAVSKSNGGAVASLTWSHTVSSAGSPFLVVGVEVVDTLSRTVSSVTYNGVGMTQLYALRTANDASSSRRYGSWYLPNPATGAHNVVVTLSGAVDNDIGAIAGSYTSFNQTGIDSNNESHLASGTATSYTLSTTTASPNTWLIGFVPCEQALTAGANTTVRDRAISTNFSISLIDSNGRKTPQGSYSLAVTNTASGYEGMMLISLAEIDQSVTFNQSDTNVTTDTLSSINKTDPVTITDTNITTDNETLKYGWGINSKSSTTWTNQNKS